MRLIPRQVRDDGVFKVKPQHYLRIASKTGEMLREALEEVRAVYTEVENRPIERACIRRTECCHFKLTGRTPQLTKGEAILAAKAVRAAGRKVMPEREDGACPLLKENGACLIYQDRPFGCRTHFCAAAGGPYSRAEVLDLIRRLEAVDVRLSGSGPRALPGAVREELRALM
jgi:Fe-S-cluster containining protein